MPQENSYTCHRAWVKAGSPDLLQEVISALDTKEKVGGKKSKLVKVEGNINTVSPDITVITLTPPLKDLYHFDMSSQENEMDTDILANIALEVLAQETGLSPKLFNRHDILFEALSKYVVSGDNMPIPLHLFAFGGRELMVKYPFLSQITNLNTRSYELQGSREKMLTIIEEVVSTQLPEVANTKQLQIDF